MGENERDDMGLERDLFRWVLKHLAAPKMSIRHSDVVGDGSEIEVVISGVVLDSVQVDIDEMREIGRRHGLES